MGCGAFSGELQKPIFINEVNRDLRVLKEFPGSFPDLIPPIGAIESEGTVFFDHKEHFKQAQVAFITELSVEYDLWIKKINVVYYSDGETVKAKSSHSREKTAKLTLRESDVIQDIEISHSADYINSIHLKTKNGKKLDVTGSEGTGPLTSTVSLAKETRGLIGFRGTYSEYLTSLYTYSWRITRSANR